MGGVKRPGRGARSTISRKNQVTLPIAALHAAGLAPGDRLRIEVAGPGELTLVREPDPVTAFAGSLAGVYPPGYLDGLRDEWP